jgi:hypothetical protein
LRFRKDCLHQAVHSGASDMQDLVWIGVILGLLGLSLAYIRLCDNA